MADPLSITASLITILSTTKGVVKRAKVLRGAPQELEDLLSDITRFDNFLLNIRRRSWSSDDSVDGLRELLEDAQKKLLEFNEFVQYTLTKAGSSDKVDHWQWLRKQDHVRKLRDNLREARANLMALLGVEIR